MGAGNKNQAQNLYAYAGQDKAGSRRSRTKEHHGGRDDHPSGQQ
jgi:hypothetical protein